VYAVILLFLFGSRILEVTVMNTRFKFLLINYLGRYKLARNSGFALPMAIMVGACIIIVGLAVVIQAQGNQSKVVSQKAKATSMAATETGLTRIQSMMNDVKFIALYPMSDWTSAMTLSNDKTTVTLTSGSSLATKVNTIAASTACSNTGSDVTTKENEIKAKLAQLLVATNSTMTNIDSNDSSKGKYKLVGYSYTGTAGAMPSTTQTGGLIIQGENGEGGTGSASRIAVDIPISGASGGVGASDVVPGLWLKKGGVNDGTSYETTSLNTQDGSSKYAANVYFTDCASALSNSYVSSVQSSLVAPGTIATKTSLAFPSLPYQPTSAVQTISTPTTLNGSGQTEVNGVFHYVINNTNTTANVLVSAAVPEQPAVAYQAAQPAVAYQAAQPAVAYQAAQPAVAYQAPQPAVAYQAPQPAVAYRAAYCSEYFNKSTTCKPNKWIAEVPAKDAVPEILAKAAVPEILAKAAVPEILAKAAVPEILAKAAVPEILAKAAVPAVPAVYSSAVTVSPPSGKQIYVYNYLADISSSETFPRTKDIPSSDGKFRYKIAGNINLGGNDNVVINTDSTLGIIFYLNGDMVFKGNPDLTVTCSATSTAAQKAACSSKFQVYGYKTNGEICLKGGADQYGYILAPDYDMGKTGNGSFFGSLFGRSWGKIQNCGSNNGKVAVTQQATWSQVPGEIKPSTYSPTLGNFTAYTTKPVE
jgi:hypothetical protein